MHIKNEFEKAREEHFTARMEKEDVGVYATTITKQVQLSLMDDLRMVE